VEAGEKRKKVREAGRGRKVDGGIAKLARS